MPPVGVTSTHRQCAQRATEELTPGIRTGTSMRRPGSSGRPTPATQTSACAVGAGSMGTSRFKRSKAAHRAEDAAGLVIAMRRLRRTLAVRIAVAGGNVPRELGGRGWRREHADQQGQKERKEQAQGNPCPRRALLFCPPAAHARDHASTRGDPPEPQESQGLQSPGISAISRLPIGTRLGAERKDCLGNQGLRPRLPVSPLFRLTGLSSLSYGVRKRLCAGCPKLKRNRKANRKWLSTSMCS